MFQSNINAQIPVGVEGARASDNPISSVLGSFIANPAGVRVGSFAWIVAGLAYSYSVNGKAPDGFVANTQNAVITDFKGRYSMVIPSGVPVSLFDRGDFWARATYSDAAIGDKVFANLFNGKIQAGAAGSSQVDPIGTSGTITASFATNVMTPTAGSIYIAPGMLVTGTGIPANTYVEVQLTGTAGACTAATYQLTTIPGTIASSAAVVLSSNDGVGGFTGTASFATSVMTVATAPTGQLAVGQVITSAGVAAGTYITSLGTGTGGVGTYNLSTTPGTITTQAVTASAWVETPFYVKSAGNLGDLIKIGVKN